MAQNYAPVSIYIETARILLQDLIAPYRYTDFNITVALDIALSELGRIRPDIFLDLKYQNPLRKGDIDDGNFTIMGPVVDETIIVPIPNRYIAPVHYFVSGWLQLMDVTDTQDQRAQAFLAKFQQQLLSVSAA